MFCDPMEVLSEWRSFLPVVRVACGCEWRVLPCSSQVVAVKLHWFKRRTVPCVASVGECPGCVTPARPMIYLGCHLRKDGPTGPALSPQRVLELPVSAWAFVAQEAKAAGGLLSVSFRVYRHGGKRGRILCDEFDQSNVQGAETLSEREIVQALCRLWSIPSPRLGELDADWLTRVGVAISCEGHYRASKG